MKPNLAKNTIFLILGLLILIFILVLTLILSKPAEEKIVDSIPIASYKPTDEEKNFQSPTIISFNPPSERVLVPGEDFIMNITISNNVDPSNLGIYFEIEDVPTGNNKVVPFTQSLNASTRILTIRLNEPVVPNSVYKIGLIDNSSGSTILHVNYRSDAELSSVTTNNLELSKYLPLRGDNYSLVYVPERNVYVFSFSFDESSDDSIDEQYETARESALDFIRGKGIEPESLIIEWRYH